MFKYFSITALLIFLTINIVQAKPLPDKVLMYGKVVDQLTGQVLEGASIYFPELKKGVATNNKGAYQISLTPGKYLLEVSYIGYTLQTINVDVQNSLEKDFALNHNVVENTNVTVTSFLRATSSKRTPTPISITNYLLR